MGSVLTLRALPFLQVVTRLLVPSPSIRPLGDKRSPLLLLPKFREALGVGLELGEQKVKPGVSPKLILKSKSGLVAGAPTCCLGGVVLLAIAVRTPPGTSILGGVIVIENESCVKQQPSLSGVVRSPMSSGMQARRWRCAVMGLWQRATDSDVDVGCCPVAGAGDLELGLTKAVVDDIGNGSVVELRCRRRRNAKCTCRCAASTVTGVVVQHGDAVVLSGDVRGGGVDGGCCWVRSKSSPTVNICTPVRQQPDGAILILNSKRGSVRELSATKTKYFNVFGVRLYDEMYTTVDNSTRIEYHQFSGP